MFEIKNSKELIDIIKDSKYLFIMNKDLSHCRRSRLKKNNNKHYIESYEDDMICLDDIYIMRTTTSMCCLESTEDTSLKYDSYHLFTKDNDKYILITNICCVK